MKTCYIHKAIHLTQKYVNLKYMTQKHLTQKHVILKYVTQKHYFEGD